MATEPDDLSAIIRAVLEEETPPVSDADIDAALADPAMAAIIARAVAPHETKLTPKGLDRMRRTVAVVFLTDPAAASLLTRVREGEDESGTVPSKNADAKGRATATTPRGRRR